LSKEKAMSVLNSNEMLKELYLPPVDDFVQVIVPNLRYIQIDGEGDPDGDQYKHAMAWIFAVVHPLRLFGRQHMGKNFVEPPLECLWWADDLRDFIAGRRDKFKWRLMIVADADWITTDRFNEAVQLAGKRLGAVPSSLRMEPYAEGRSVQIMHLGPPGSQSATLARLYSEYIPANHLIPRGYYHEIYLNDARRTAPGKLRTVLRQPVE
jgi:hypothetical protein